MNVMGRVNSAPALADRTLLLPRTPPRKLEEKSQMSYASSMLKTRDINSSSRNKNMRAAFNGRVPGKLVDEEAMTRLSAVNALGKMKLEAGPQAGLVVARLEDDDPRVRRRAIWALKEMTAGQLEPHKHLIAARLEHRNPEVRAAAAE